MSEPIHAVWVIRSFLDYRIPVFRALSDLLDDRFHVIFSGDYVPESVIAKARSALGDRAIVLEGEWQLGPEDRHTMANSVVSLRYQPGLVKTIRDCDPDVLICEGFFKWTVGGWLYKLRQRVPIVINYERTGHTERQAQWFRTTYRRTMLRFADAVCCNGKLSADYVVSLGMDRDRITTGHMVADTDLMAGKADATSPETIARLRQQWNARGKVLLYVGSLSERKGIHHLLNAWQQLEQRHADKLTLVLVGGGAAEEQMRQQARDAGLEHIHFTGSIPYDELGSCYAAADAFIIPTLEDNWSLVVPEAMAAGLPVLCSRYNGCWPELVEEGRNGWVFDPLDPRSFLGVLESCLAAVPDLKRMGDASRAIIGRHTPQTAAQSIYDACHIAIAARRTAHAHAS